MFLPATRAALVLAILLLAIFGILDLWMLPDSYGDAWRIRYLALVPINAAVLARRASPTPRSNSFHAIYSPAIHVFRWC
ncbi:MAG: hypothetical protein NXI24_15495 [bacterium]|nr:hypothetical protein [bacterium]